MICVKLEKQRICSKKGMDLSMLIRTILKIIKGYIKESNDLIKEAKIFKDEVTPKSGLNQEDVDNFYIPLYKNIKTLMNQLSANESIENLNWDDTIFNDINLPSHLKKDPTKWRQLKTLIEQTRDFFQQICYSCEGKVIESIRKSELHLIDNEKSQQLLNEVAIKLGYLALGYNSYLNNNGLKEFIDTYTEIEFKDEESSTISPLSIQNKKEQLIHTIMISIPTVDNVKEYNDHRKEVYELLKSIENKLSKEVDKFNNEKRKK